MHAFLLICLFAIIFVLSYMPAVNAGRYGNALNIAGQAGLGISLLLFFAIKGKKRPPGGTRRDY